MKKIHLVVGYSFFILFLGTGLYMESNFPDLYHEQEEVRMMFRSTHIYLLMAALINISAANNIAAINVSFLRYCNFFASLLLLTAPVILFAAFIVEPAGYLIDRPLTIYGIWFMLIGVVVGNLLKSQWLSRIAT